MTSRTRTPGAGIVVASLCATIALAIPGCSLVSATRGYPKETVLEPGESVEAQTPNGWFRVTGVSRTSRRFEWRDDGRGNGGGVEVRMDPRLGRWDGLLGLYSAGSNRGPVRVVAQEGQLHARDFDEIRDWMSVAPGAGWVYNDQGLLVGFRAVPQRDQINVDVIQIYIDGELPQGLPGSNSDAIRVLTGPNPR